MRPHTTHHDDCGCLSERLADALRERDTALSLSAAHEDAFKVVAKQRDDARRAAVCAENQGRALAEGHEQMRQEGRRLLLLLAEAAEVVCSLQCPSVWKTGTSQPHGPLCERIRAALDGRTERDRDAAHALTPLPAFCTRCGTYGEPCRCDAAAPAPKETP
jgi:hypothetical protein